MKSRLSFVLPNYNGADLLRRNLPAVLVSAQACGCETEVVVVDDASTDDSAAVLAREFPQVQVVERKRNGGFSRTVNEGIEAARGDLIVLLNTDIRPEPSFLDLLLPYFAEPETFAVSPLIRDENSRAQRTSWNLVDFRRGEIRKRTWNLEDVLSRVNRGERLVHLYPCCGAAVLRRDYFLRLGGFDLLFSPFYYEDFDLGIRAWQAGWRVYFEPRSTVIHEHRGSIAASFSRKRVKRTSRRNRFLFLWIHLSRRKLWSNHVPFSLVRLLTRTVTLDRIYPAALWRALGFLTEVRQRRARLRDAIPLDELVKRLGNENV